MLGPIIGDIVGSIYEFNNIRTKSFPLFSSDCFFTDDTVMTIAVAEAVMNGGKSDDFIDAMKKYGRMYPHSGYGGKFRIWLLTDSRKPYGSFGNGSAMRVAPCGWMPTLEDCRRLARISAEVTHNHPEGVKGALATADAIFICRQTINNGGSPEECRSLVKEHVEKEYGYNLSRTCDQIRPTYEFNETCQETVPQAIVAFLDSTDFEDAIRNAISLGGDSDTLAAITGSVAEAAYGIPEWISEKALSYLDERLIGVLERWKRFTEE
ncbi:MAG: ADP-ribosylglycohydrolase family protein [Oscillospiraceae bacterium]|nr:ADP-ribosylglycohydrolase family protein [Oscillospiraceae bacterium]